MGTLAVAADVLWYPHHFLEGTRFLGRRGVFFQQEHHDCGCAALMMILSHFDLTIDYGWLRQLLCCGPEGTTLLSLKRSAEAAGLKCDGWRLTPPDLMSIPLPAVLLLCRKHFAVMQSFESPDSITILDPVRGRLRIGIRRLASLWNGETLLFCKSRHESAASSWFA
jgi:ABC-type bacteriocin/lantibiotic exporter with double-glycine peptidase domain